ncbi:MAG: hypothetical protein HC849_26605 [Oscillatoriales cyanobacterium RU_3_3]|nr:hypothetical protein [Oscillatoriales cyanobacterium RU_3_3]
MSSYFCVTELHILTEERQRAGGRRQGAGGRRKKAGGRRKKEEGKKQLFFNI